MRTLLSLTLSLLLSLSAAADPDSVVVAPGTVSLQPGDTYQFDGNAWQDGQKVDGAMSRWFSSDPQTVRATQTGEITALRTGDVSVSLMIDGVFGIARVVVNQPPASSVTIEEMNPTVRVGESFPMDPVYMTAEGEVKKETMSKFASADESIATVDATGRVTGRAVGSTTVTISGDGLETSVPVSVTANTSKSYDLAYLPGPYRTGDVIRFQVNAYSEDGSSTEMVTPSWFAGGRLGAQIEREGSEGVFVAEEPGTYTITAVIGPELSKTTVVTIEPREYEATLEKLGRGPAAHHHSGDTWAWEGVDGRDYAIVGTFMHDWAKVWDITDPENVMITDSIQVDARRINDVKIHPNNRIGIITREGASSRRNGIVLLDLSTPAHPTILSEYTETVTGGVHNVWMEGDLVYAIHNGTSDMHILDIADPQNIEEVGRWSLGTESRVLHDVIVQEGYAYLSYWDDGVVTLDVGAGTHGGTPTEPKFVSRYSYPEGNTHVAWRHGKYLYVGDEIFPNDWNPDAPIEARGYIHVLDMTDIDNPVEVAKYEVPEAGVHNVWAEGDRLYVGYYQAGLRVLDISGELRGDLYQQGREIAKLKTVDAQSTVPNWGMTWGAQIHKGNIITSDLNSGLWIARLKEKVVIP